MCMMCDGASLDDVRFHIHGMVERHGFAIIPVDGAPSWAYTIGLSRGFEHPELIVLGHSPPDAAAVINSLVDEIEEGVRLEPGVRPRCVEHGGTVTLLEVDRGHWANGTFNMWLDYYGALGPPYPMQWAMQAIPSCCEPPVLLDRPAAVLRDGPNRAARRAADRAAKRRHKRGPHRR